jgi:stage V sporulation protein G
MKSKQLKITAEIKKLFDDGGKVKAAAALVIGGVFVVRGIRLIDGSKGMFVSMPSQKSADGEYFDICFPINGETRQQIFDTVMAAYEKALTGQSADDEAPDDETAEQETA